jgi:hypothetical protein
MNYSYATLDEAWKESRSASPTPSSISSNFSNQTLVMGTSKPIPNPIPIRDYVVSPTPSVSSLGSTSSWSGWGSSVNSRSVSPSPSSGPLFNERVPPIDEPGVLPGQSLPTSGSVSPVGTGSRNGEDSRIIKQILRIRDDIKAALQSKDDDNSTNRFPIVETGLFISVGLFVLIVMNMMLKMGKNHVSYRFTLE